MHMHIKFELHKGRVKQNLMSILQNNFSQLIHYIPNILHFKNIRFKQNTFCLISSFLDLPFFVPKNLYSNILSILKNNLKSETYLNFEIWQRKIYHYIISNRHLWQRLSWGKYLIPAVIGIFNKFPHIEHKAINILGSNIKDIF